jgi:hypothetical protein
MILTQIKEITREQYRKYSAADGSHFIASEYALYRILRLIQKFKPKHILEVGVGIGTISDSIIKSTFEFQPILYGTEKNQFCLEKLPRNMKSTFGKLNLFPDIQTLPTTVIFNFIIIDGKEKDLISLKNHMDSRCIVVIEGDRKDQTKLIRELFPSAKFVHSICSRKNNNYSNRPKTHFQGGLKIIFTNPDIKQYFEWIKLRMNSKLNFQLRKLKNDN